MEIQKGFARCKGFGKVEDCFILLQHPPTFTFGRRYKEDNLITNKEYYGGVWVLPFIKRIGGLATYHGPGQLVGYPIIKISTYTKDYYQYLRMLEEVMIRTLIDFGIASERNGGYTGSG